MHKLSLFLMLCIFLLTNAADVDLSVSNICQNCNNSDLLECSKVEVAKITDLFKCVEAETPCTLAHVSQNSSGDNVWCLINISGDSEYFNTADLTSFAEQVVSTISTDTTVDIPESTLSIEDYSNDESNQVSTPNSDSAGLVTGVKPTYKSNFSCFQCEDHMDPDCGTNPKKTHNCYKYENVTVGCYLMKIYINGSGVWFTQRDCLHLPLEEFMSSCQSSEYCNYCLTPNCNTWSVPSLGIAQQTIYYKLMFFMFLIKFI